MAKRGIKREKDGQGEERRGNLSGRGEGKKLAEKGGGRRGVTGLTVPKGPRKEKCNLGKRKK